MVTNNGFPLDCFLFIEEYAKGVANYAFYWSWL